jgi:hypothetical protein
LAQWGKKTRQNRRVNALPAFSMSFFVKLGRIRTQREVTQNWEVRLSILVRAL